MTAWTREQAIGAVRQTAAALPRIQADEIAPVVPDHDVWDMWQVMRRDGSTAVIEGRTWWFYLAAPRLDDPEWRHDVARIRLTSLGDDGWRDHGDAFPEGLTPGSREWSGSAVLEDDRGTITMYFTASGRRGVPRTFEQRLFESLGRLADGRTSNWTKPVESVAADGRTYLAAQQADAVDGRIKGFRDPCWFCDPRDGVEYLLFAGSAGWVDEVDDGVIGLARRDADAWQLRPPLVTAIGVNSELERAHIVVHDGLYYLFWSTQAKRFAPGIAAPTGLYGMVAERVEGPYRPLNDTGLVAANPADEPFQAYCWVVTDELEVTSFIDYAGLAGADPASSATLRRCAFGGTVAPGFSLRLDGTRAMIAP